MTTATVTGRHGAESAEEPPTARCRSAVEDEIGVLSAQIHMLEAQLAQSLAELDSLHGWAGQGVRSLGQWLSIHAKFAMPEARRIASLAHRLDSVPTLLEEARSGRVSIGVMLNAARISNPDNEAAVARVALRCTPNQSARIFSRFLDAKAPKPDPASPDPEPDYWWRIWHDRLGRGRIDASLDPVTLALMEQAWRAARAAGERDVHRGADDDHGRGESEPYDGRPPRLGANEIASRMASTMIDAAHADGVRAPGGEKFRVQVNVDVETLAKILNLDLSPSGVFRLGSECFLTSTGRHLNDSEAARVLCDSSLQVLIHHKGIPMWLGNEHRSFTRHQRRAMAFRSDGRGGCEFPGCDQTHYVEGHHVIEHNAKGETALDNGMLLCGYHHRELHRQGWRVTTDGTQTYTFWEGKRCLGSTTRSDQPGGRPPDIRGETKVNSPPAPPDWINGETPKSETMGEPLSAYAFSVFLDTLLAA